MEKQFKKIWKKGDESEVKEKHVPVISIEESKEGVKIKVKIGSVEHPSEPGHFIQWIEVLDGEISLSRVYLTPFCKPETVFFAKEKPTKLVAKAFCNLHGTWQYD